MKRQLHPEFDCGPTGSMCELKALPIATDRLPTGSLLPSFEKVLFNTYKHVFSSDKHVFSTYKHVFSSDKHVFSN
ncbi:hypothetical protein FACS1894200_10930 [Spirochaetia bacterium]|nr:hypothetical protein FACS1894200_10930 [Spirochaetia bacterium]